MNNSDTFRLFSLVLYENNFNDIFKNVLTNNLTYFYIFHQAEEDNKKNHFHLVIYTPRATSISKIARLLGVECNDINIKNESGTRYTLKQTIGYLLHYKMENKKFHYELDKLINNNQELVNKYYNIISDNNNTSRQFNDLICFIEDNHITSLKELTMYCINNGCLDILKKYQYILVNILNEERRY